MSNPEIQEHPQVLVVGPDGIARSGNPQDESGEHERPVTEMVEQPAKVMRIGSMIRQLLEEVRAAPLDEKSRARLKAIHESSIKELEDGLAPELVSELERLSLPFTENELPSEGELRVAQAPLVGWRACSTASRPRCSPSRWRPGPSSSRCAARCRRA
jgi:proteasome activator-like protein